MQGGLLGGAQPPQRYKRHVVFKAFQNASKTILNCQTHHQNCPTSLSGGSPGASWAALGRLLAPRRLDVRAVLEASWAAIVAHMAPQSLLKWVQNSIKTDAKIGHIFGSP